MRGMRNSIQETGGRTSPRAVTPQRTNPMDITYPLNEFYALAKRELPPIEQISGEKIPKPYKSLLVHNNDMTPTLEKFHSSQIHLEIRKSEQRNGFYFREVILRLDGSNRPVEFGANKIHLSRFPEAARKLILEERVPLGTILKQCALNHHTEANTFLRVESDAMINEAFGLKSATILYGRKAAICDARDELLSEIVEILPP